MKVFYHNDADGKCAAHLVSRAVGEYVISPGVLEFIEMDYTDDFPFEKISRDEKVWILDFSIQPEEMKKLLGITGNVIWIDHHRSAIEKYLSFEKANQPKPYGDVVDISGIRSEKYSGCELVWLYLNIAVEVRGEEVGGSSIDFCPHYVRLVGDRDTWTFAFGDDSKAFHEEFRAAGEPGPESTWWDICALNSPGLIEELARGSRLMCHSAQINKAHCDSWSYESEFEGHSILVCNTNVFSSDLFGDRINDYPFVAVYCHTGINWKASLYSTKMDVLEFAIKHGGGGHPRACGFVSDEVPFEKIERVIKTDNSNE